MTPSAVILNKAKNFFPRPPGSGHRLFQRPSPGKQFPSNRLRLAVEMGFVTSVDILYGLPGQSPLTVGETIGRLIDCGIHGLSAYRLNRSDMNDAFLRAHPGFQPDPQRDYVLLQRVEHLMLRAGYPKNHFVHYAMAPDDNRYFRHLGAPQLRQRTLGANRHRVMVHAANARCDSQKHTPASALTVMRKKAERSPMEEDATQGFAGGSEPDPSAVNSTLSHTEVIDFSVGYTTISHLVLLHFRVEQHPSAFQSAQLQQHDAAAASCC